ncbi:biopolymer transporter ExbD [uncultured Duncaniella sp.]|uniref:ExbD/TolR family protein n=1 Tax=uncultured Duncaniella sp. TaxID=2768039 RepID=UPI001B647072|nr:biopolymer transporter ExbD [uncultured Duncaniella sp.]MBP3304273.1 biopolymer transporter ExbD [Muribaculaceae bacterium]
MALKRQHRMMEVFSMASMTDVIFLLLIFFMVTSTFVFPTALEVNLPESSHQTSLKPSTRVFIDKDSRFYVSISGEEPSAVELESLAGALQDARVNSTPDSDDFIAVYADEEVTYGTLVKVLDLGAQNNLKMVLATKPAPASARPE